MKLVEERYAPGADVPSARIIGDGYADYSAAFEKSCELQDIETGRMSRARGNRDRREVYYVITDDDGTVVKVVAVTEANGTCRHIDVSRHNESAFGAVTPPRK